MIHGVDNEDNCGVRRNAASSLFYDNHHIQASSSDCTHCDNLLIVIRLYDDSAGRSDRTGDNNRLQTAG